MSVARDTLFSSVVDMGAYVEIQMADSTVYRINKKYSVAVDSTVISMAVSDTVAIRYNVCGVEFETVELMTQNGFEAAADTASNTLKFISPESFDSSTSQVVAFFRFKQDDSFTKIVCIPFDFIKKEEEEQ